MVPTLSMSSAVAIRRTPRASGMSATSKVLICVAQLMGHGFFESVSSQSSALVAPSSDSSSMNELTTWVRFSGRVYLAVETCVYASALEAGLLERPRSSLRRPDRIEASLSDRDDLVEVHGRLPRLVGIRLRAGRFFGRDESLRERDGGVAASSSPPPHATSATTVTATTSEMPKRTGRDPTKSASGSQASERARASCVSRSRRDRTASR